MSKGTPFLIGADERETLKKLREAAAASPVDVGGLKTKIASRAGMAAYVRQMTAQTVYLPFNYAVAFSIETGHPCGTARHMSMSSPVAGRLPRPEAVWMAAEALGFTGKIEDCAVWLEDLKGHGHAVNLAQPISAMSVEGRA